MIAPRWLIFVIIITALVIIWDEIAFQTWKFSNPGAQWSRVAKDVAPLVDPSTPPRSWG